MQTLERRIAEAKTAIREQAPAGIERREVEVALELRAAEGDSWTFVGHAAVFDRSSEDLGGWTERIKRGAFKRVLADDVRFLVNHDSNLLLARTTSGTLRLKEDGTGLHVEADIAPTTLGKDLRILVERGDMSQMSFAFIVGEADWSDEGEDLVRTVTRMEALVDVSPVTYPAYPQTDGGVRTETSTTPPDEEQTPEAVVAERGGDGPSEEPQVSDDPVAPEQAGAWRLAGRQRRLRQRPLGL